MIIMVYFVSLLLACTTLRFAVSASEIGTQKPLSGYETPYYLKQLQLLKLFNNMKCLRDEDVHEISNTLNPLDNLYLYDEPELVRTYFEGLQRGEGLRNDQPLTNNPITIGDIKQVLRIYLSIEDWDLFYKTAAYCLGRVNPGVIFWALSALVHSKFTHENFRTPPSYEVLPHWFTAKSILYQANGMEDVKSNLSNGIQDKLNYFKDDPILNNFHLAYHTTFPYWWDADLYKIKKERKGELFLYMHRQLVNRYRVERISAGGFQEVPPADFDEDLGPGYVPYTLNIDLSEFPPRLNNSRFMDLPTQTVQSSKEKLAKLIEGISKGYFVTENGTRVYLGNNAGYDIVSATAEASETSVNPTLYGSLHNQLHGFISRIADPDGSLNLTQGLIAFPEVSIMDPAFFRIHYKIDSIYALQSRNLKPYTESDLRLPGVDLIGVRVTKKGHRSPETPMWFSEASHSTPILETYSQKYSYDAANAIKSCVKPQVVPVRRWNHKPFKYYLKVNSERQRCINSTVRIYMCPIRDYNGKHYPEDKLYNNMIEMDRFTVTLSPGENIIGRSSEESAVTVPDPILTKQLFRETEEALANGEEKPETQEKYRHCGWPHHMLVPKGTRKGTKFKMFVILTQGEQDLDYPGLPLCGVETGTFPDKKPMGFPFDRKVKFGHSRHPRSYGFIDLIVKHKH